MLERLAEKNGDMVRIVKVDVSKNQQWAQNENVRGIPAFRFYSGGMLVDQFSGALPEQSLQSRIDRHATVLEASAASSQKVDKDGNPIGPAPQPTVRPMPKKWLPAGVSEG